MPFKFQWQIEKHCSELGVGGPGLVLMSLLSKIKERTFEESILK